MRFETEIKQWGNSLALRISAAMAKEPRFTKGTKVIVDTSDGELKIELKEKNKLFSLPFSEAQLLIGLDEVNSHADELATLTAREY
jgi:antitoxin MazE